MSTQIHEPGEGIRTIDIGGSLTIAKADVETRGAASLDAEAREPAPLETLQRLCSR